MSSTDASMNSTRSQQILNGNNIIRNKSKKDVYDVVLSNNQAYNNYIKGFNHMLSNMMILNSQNIHNEVRKSARHLDKAQYIRYKNYQQFHPRYSNFEVANIGATSPEAIIIAADGQSPTPDTVNNCWSFTNSGGNKINWYFYADGGFNLNPPSSFKVSDLECFYFVVKLNNPGVPQKEFNKPWMTVYSQPENTSVPPPPYADYSWYRSRWNYSGFYDNGNSYALNSGTYIFYIGDLKSLYTYNKSLPSYKLSDYPVGVGSVLNTNAPDSQTALNEGLFLISIGTDSSAATGKFDFCIKEVGYKIKGQVQEIIKTTA